MIANPTLSHSRLPPSECDSSSVGITNDEITMHNAQGKVGRKGEGGGAAGVGGRGDGLT